MKGYKGFKKGLICKRKKYKENTIFEEQKAEICNSGMHFCVNPIDVLDYYGFVNTDEEIPTLNEFAEVESLDEAITNDGLKYCTKKLKVGAKLSIAGFIKAFVDFTLEKINANELVENTGDYSASTNTGDYSASTNTGYRSASTNTGNYSASTNTGDCSASTNTGDCSASTNTGDYSASTVEGKDSIAIAWGRNSKAKGSKGCYLVLAEYNENGDIINAKMEYVDGKKIKDGIFYKLVDGKFEEVKDE
nr:MAG TPA: hypothetical protein [Caudoviricetes sp.]